MAQKNSYIPVRASSFPTSHPRTGAPFEPIGYVAGRAVWPMLGAAEGDDAAQAAAQAAAATAAAAAATGSQSEDGSFPANTPVAEMTLQQQVAYHRYHSRKHEERVKAYGGRTPEQVAEAFEKAKRQDELEHELSSEADKRERAAREATSAELEAKYRPRVARAEFKAAAIGRIDASKIDGILAPFGDMSYFLADNGEVDTDKVSSYIDSIAPAMGTQQQRKGPTVTGHGSGSSTSTRSGGGSVAEVMAERRAAREAKQ